jgi:elongation factor P--beta-lysine ligase
MSNYFLLHDYLEVQLPSMDASEGTDESIATGN